MSDKLEIGGCPVPITLEGKAVRLFCTFECSICHNTAA